jgi:hypothetical protein
MNRFKAGDDVTVSIKGKDHRGEVLTCHQTGFITCRVIADPEWDYGRTTWIDPEQTVCVRESSVTAAAHYDTPGTPIT